MCPLISTYKFAGFVNPFSQVFLIFTAICDFEQFLACRSVQNDSGEILPLTYRIKNGKKDGVNLHKNTSFPKIS